MKGTVEVGKVRYEAIHETGTKLVKYRHSKFQDWRSTVDKKIVDSFKENHG